MWKFVPAFTSKLLHKQRYFINSPIRSFLSEAFKLENVWGQRLNSPILSKINVNDMFFELDHQFQHFANANAFDIDLFVNAVNGDLHFDEVDDVVHKLRLSPEAVNILPSTQHALIRLYMEYNKTEDLMRILDDRLNYGIFSDTYCSLLMMDSFIKSGNFRDAAKVSTLNMLQEDVSHPLIKYMSLYACHKYLENPVPWNVEENDKVEGEEENNEEDEDEVVKVRVKYIRNPYYDDHFDIVDPQHLIGKTFTMIGSEINSYLGNTYTLLGLLLHDKFEPAKEYIKSLSKSKEKFILVKDGLDMAKNILDEKAKLEGKDENFQALISEVKGLLDNTVSVAQLNAEDTLLVMVENTLKDLINKNEASEINKQLELYKQWEQNRANLLKEQIAKANRDKQLLDIQRQKQLLQEKEEELFFFDNENKLDLIIEEKEKAKEEQKEKDRLRIERRSVRPPTRQVVKEKKELPLESFFDENIPMKLVKTKL